jgi:uncharacterized membrane protein YhhN
VRTPRLLLTAYGLAGAADLACLAAGAGAGHAVVKPLLMPLLAAAAAGFRAPRPLLAALLCGWGGDVLLLTDGTPGFLAGMACFAAGHVCYLLLFRAHGAAAGAPHPRGRRLLAPAYAAALAAGVSLLWPELPVGRRVPVAAYGVLLTTMAYGAAVRLGAVAGVGGALFVLSDALIAAGLADWPRPPRPDFWIMLTYVAAQFLLVTGALRGGTALPTVRHEEVGEAREVHEIHEVHEIAEAAGCDGFTRGWAAAAPSAARTPRPPRPARRPPRARGGTR